jgi:extradiol dioxygenase family protein
MVKGTHGGSFRVSLNSHRCTNAVDVWIQCLASALSDVQEARRFYSSHCGVRDVWVTLWVMVLTHQVRVVTQNVARRIGRNGHRRHVGRVLVAYQWRFAPLREWRLRSLRLRFVAADFKEPGELTVILQATKDQP